jgi:hypothetical protein
VVFALFTFRLLFGLSREFFFEDDTQIFLLGLRYYSTGSWPFFGPDVVWTMSELPGALQALLVGIPLKIAAIPESPFVLLNLLSTGALAALAWYICEQLPQLPRWLVWGWFMTIPWTLQFSTHVINPSYVLPAAVMFFIGFFESLPALSLGYLRPWIAYFLMGASLTWILQIHMSWPLLLPYIVVAWLSRRRDGAAALAVNAAALVAGAIMPGALLIPTLLRYGAGGGTGGVGRSVQLHWVNPVEIVVTLARLLSFASLEINRFVGADGAKRLELFERHMWLAPIAAVVWIAGVVQPIWMLVALCRPSTRWLPGDVQARWRTLRWLVAATVVLIYAAYWFVAEPPQAHAFYLLAPVAFVFAAFWWTTVDSPRARKIAAVVLVLNIALHAGLAFAQVGTQSLYKNRRPVAAALRLKQPEMFAHRRPFAKDAGPYVLSDPRCQYDSRRDMEVVMPRYEVGIGRALRWTVTVRNRSSCAAFRDFLYVTRYSDGSHVVQERIERVRDIFEPGTSRAVEINDGSVRPAFTTATIEIIAAEALMPTPEGDR